MGEGERKKWRDGREMRQRGSEPTSTLEFISTPCVQIGPRDERAVCPVGRDFSLPRLTPQNFGSDGTHTLGGLFNVIGIRAHNESHSPNSGAGCAHPGLYPLARTTWAPFPLSASWTSLAPSALGQNYPHKLFRGDNETLGSGRGKLCDPPGSRRGTLCLSDLGSLCSSVLAICPPVVSVL